MKERYNLVLPTPAELWRSTLVRCGLACLVLLALAAGAAFWADQPPGKKWGGLEAESGSQAVGGLQVALRWLGQGQPALRIRNREQSTAGGGARGG